MSVTIKSEHEIELMREAGRILAAVHQQLGKEIKPGMSTKDVDRLGEEMRAVFLRILRISGLHMCFSKRGGCAWYPD